MNIFQRLKSDTPKFFRTLRNIGLGVVAAGTAIITLPVSITAALPAVVILYAGHAVAVGTAVAAVSQAVYKEDKTN